MIPIPHYVTVCFLSMQASARTRTFNCNFKEPGFALKYGLKSMDSSYHGTLRRILKYCRVSLKMDGDV